MCVPIVPLKLTWPSGQECIFEKVYMNIENAMLVEQVLQGIEAVRQNPVWASRWILKFEALPDVRRGCIVGGAVVEKGVSFEVFTNSDKTDHYLVAEVFC